MKKRIFKALLIFLCFAVFSLNMPSAVAGGNSAVTTVSIIIEAFGITSKTEDFTLGVGEDEVLMFTASESISGCLWEVSSDGGQTFTPAPGENTLLTYQIEDAEENKNSEGEDIPYQYRLTATGISGRSGVAIIRVLVSDEYSYRTIIIRGEEIEVSAYMHDATRLVITPLPENTAAALTLEQQLSEDCLPLLICDVTLLNKNDEVVPYFGELQVDFNVGSEYEGQRLRAFHLHEGEIISYYGTVSGGVLSITVNRLSPFMIEVAAQSAETVTVTSTTGGQVIPSGRVNVPAGSDKSFTFLPDEGFNLQEVRINGEKVAFEGNSVTVNAIGGDTALEVSFVQVSPSEEFHSITVAPCENGRVSPFGVLSVRNASAQTFYFYPDALYELNSLRVNGKAVNVLGNSFTLSAVTEDIILEAEFAPSQSQPPDVYNSVSAYAGENGSVSPEGAVSVEYGGGFYFYFIPDEGYGVDRVLADGSAVSFENNSYRFINVVSPHTLSVSFKKLSPSPPTEPNKPTKPTETDPADPTDPTDPLEPLEPTEPIYHNITVQPPQNGRISPFGELKVPYGGSQTFYFIPDEGYEVESVYINGELQPSRASSYTVENITADMEIKVAFRKKGVSPLGDCDCLLSELFGKCPICERFSGCVKPWCTLVPLCLAGGVAAVAFRIVKRKNKTKNDKNN